MRVSLQIDGDAKGAEEALAATSTAVGDLGKQTAAISQAIQDGFKNAVSSIEGVKNASQSAGAANDNSATAALGLAGKLSQVAAQAAGADSALAKGAAGAVSFAKGLGDAVRAVGAFNVVGALLSLAVTAATTFYGVITSGSTEAAQRLDDTARHVTAVNSAYRDATKAAGEFYDKSKEVAVFESTRNLAKLRADLAASSPNLAAGATGSTYAPPAPFGGEIDIGYPAATQAVGPFQKAIDDLHTSIAQGKPDIEAYRTAIAEIGRASQASAPAVAAEAEARLKATDSHAKTASAIAEEERNLRFYSGTATAADRAARGLTATVATQGNEFDRLVKSMSRQIAAQEAEAQTAGKSAGEVAKLRAEFILTEAAQQAGIKVSGAYADKLQAIATRAGGAAQALALAKINDQVKFGRDTALLAPEDVAIAQQLKDVYPDVAEALNSVQASGIRANTALSTISSSASGTLVTGLADMTDGTKKLSQGAADMSKSVIRSLTEMLIKAQIVLPIFRALQSALGGFGGFLGIGGGVSNATDGIGGFGPTAPPGFDRGGYTGAGARHEAAGIVHRGEVVFSQDDVQRHGGVRAVESLRTMRGYADGGPVSPWAGASRSTSMPANSNAPVSSALEVSVTNNGTPKDVQAREVIDGRGQRRIELVLDDQQAAAISRPGSATARAMASRFAARPVGVKR